MMSAMDTTIISTDDLKAGASVEGQSSEGTIGCGVD